MIFSLQPPPPSRTQMGRPQTRHRPTLAPHRHRKWGPGCRIFCFLNLCFYSCIENTINGCLVGGYTTPLPLSQSHSLPSFPSSLLLSTLHFHSVIRIASRSSSLFECKQSIVATPPIEQKCSFVSFSRSSLIKWPMLFVDL